MGKIWVAGQGFEVDAKVVRWDEAPYFDGHKNQCVNPSRSCPGGVFPFSTKKPVRRANRFAARPQLRKFRGSVPPLKAVQGVVRQFILHHDGLRSAASCFDVLHNERGLSCHFLLDNDGTIYQTLDLAFMGFHAAGFNASSVGIEMCNRGDAKKYPTFYKGKRNVATCKIHDHIYLAFDYTEAQYEAMRALVRGLARALPNMPIDYPQTSPGYPAWGEIAGAKSYAGLLGHYHTTRRKWDPGPFDFKQFCESIRGQLSFPIALRERPEVPDDDDQRKSDLDKLFTRNEQKGGGFFPVGPYGDTRLWHGGIHIGGKPGDLIYAPFPGRLLAVRTGRPTSAVGSTNFVLLRHDLQVGTESVRFYTLYFHVADEWDTDAAEDGAPRWLASQGWRQGKRRADTVLLDEPIEAGDVVGRIGLAGPDDNRQAQVHLETFANEDITQKLGLKGFTLHDGLAAGRFAADPAVIKPIDEDGDGQLSRRELLAFFSSSADRTIARYMVTLHVSEWTAEPDWFEALKRTPEFRDVDDREIRELIEEQVEPTLWWDEQLARHAKLQTDGVAYHFNPITLIGAINDRLQEAKLLAPNGKNAFAAADAREKPPDVLGDVDDEAGESFLDEGELEEEDKGHELTLEDLAGGFPE
jgi:N-acetyl-anhydromuramyl-L-alanine amidase AmpD